MVAVLFELLLDPPLGFFFRASSMGAASRGVTSRGCATAAALAAAGAGAGAGDASARVAKRRVVAAATFML